MAKLPTENDVKRAILDAVASYNVRAGDIVPATALHIKVQQQGFRADEINAAMRAMEEDGLIEGSPSPVHIKITGAGFSKI